LKKVIAPCRGKRKGADRCSPGKDDDHGQYSGADDRRLCVRR
jgi:hypothetical protein